MQIDIGNVSPTPLRSLLVTRSAHVKYMASPLLTFIWPIAMFLQ